MTDQIPEKMPLWFFASIRGEEYIAWLFGARQGQIDQDSLRNQKALSMLSHALEQGLSIFNGRLRPPDVQ